jgi:FeS assembly SUF system protein
MTVTEQDRLDDLLDEVVEAISTVYDPEIPVNIYDLGLIYEINASELGVVDIKMTLTSPACPAAQSLPMEVEQRVAEISRVNKVNVEIVWDPPWNQDMMTEEGKLELGIL